jgi:hypothetical protein
VGSYRPFGPFRIAARGEARWHLAGGEFACGEFEVVDLAYDVGERAAPTRTRDPG